MPDTPSTPLPAALAGVVSAIESTEQALLAGEVERLPALSEGLARALQAAQQTLTKPDGPTRIALAAIGTRLQALQERFQTQGAAVNRTLSALFPAEQAHAYARLGQRPGMPGAQQPRVSNRTSLKA